MAKSKTKAKKPKGYTGQHFSKERMEAIGKNTRFGMNGKKGGRKPLVVELKARDAILKIIGGEAGFNSLISKIYTQAKRGSFKHQELLLNYILGKPTDRVQIENMNPQTPVGAPIIKIIADTMRLERLNKDVEDIDKSIPAERVQEMEDTLNKEINKD